jgi:hypothetical protein
MAAEIKRDPDLEWLDHVQPVGLVAAPMLLKDLGLAPTRQTQADTAAVAEQIDDDAAQPGLRDAWAFFERVLGWEVQHVAGSPGGPAVPDELHVRLPEHGTTLSPTWAVAELGAGEPRWQLLVRLEAPGVDPDARGTLEGWEASAHQRFERLLRESGVHAGVLIADKELRLTYAPRGETSGHMSFPLRALATVAGRSMLGGLKLLLDSFRLFADADDRRLPALLQKSREAQAAVSTALAEQVLGALHEALRGLDAAAPDLIREVARTQPGHLYEGLLTLLLRLVFILYAEDRDLLPSRLDGRARQIYETSYALRGLYARLTEDAALNPDTMDERRGAWGQLLALFRLIHKGHSSRFVQARGGKLFDPNQFPFLEGRAAAEEPARVLPVSDGCILRILEGLDPAARLDLSPIKNLVAVHRLREVSCLYGFTRFEAAPTSADGDLEDVQLAVRGAPIARDADWLPAIEQFGEGIFIHFNEAVIAWWLKQDATRPRHDKLLAGYGHWRRRFSGKAPPFPGTSYILLHSLSHALISEIALDCGYPASSLKERIYALSSDKSSGSCDRCGILIYTATAGAQGTLGGLVGTAPRFAHILRNALDRSAICSNDPVCADHEPDNRSGDRATHGAACHGCLLIAETSCEMRNLFLDRSLLVATMADHGASFFSLS